MRKITYKCFGSSIWNVIIIIITRRKIINKLYKYFSQVNMYIFTSLCPLSYFFNILSSLFFPLTCNFRISGLNILSYT